MDLRRDKELRITWPDGQVSVYSISLLRTQCPCAGCKELRNQSSRSLLQVLPGNWSKTPVVTDAQLVGNYALKLHWSDGHEAGIYSFEYLRSLDVPKMSCLPRTRESQTPPSDK